MDVGDHSGDHSGPTPTLRSMVGTRVTAMVGTEPSTFNWWTDVAVPFGAALIGGVFALIGAWRGAKWAAKEQRQSAGLIAAQLRRDQLQSDAFLQIDSTMSKLESCSATSSPFVRTARGRDRPTSRPVVDGARTRSDGRT